MANLILPAETDYALALREPNLLVPGVPPVGNIRPKPYWLSRGLVSAWVFGGKYGVAFDLVKKERPFLVGSDVITGPDFFQTKANASSYAELSIGAYSGLPLSFVVDSERLSGAVQWSFLRNSSTWTGIYGEANGQIKTTNSNSFDGLVSATGSHPKSNATAVSFSNNNLRASYKGGAVVIDTSAVEPAVIDRIYATIGGNRRTSGVENTSATRFRLFARFNAFLTDDELRLLSADPWQLFEPANDTPYLISVPTGGAITGTGSVAAQSSTIAGTAEREITGTSELESQSSTISGAGAVGGAITGTASLDAQSSTIEGTGTRVITSAAELVSQASVIAGTAERAITGTSAIEAQSSSIAGTGTVTEAGVVSGTGALDSQSSTISGTGILARTGTGVIAAGIASIDATGIITRVGTGALAAQSSSISGTGTVSTPQTITGTGSLICGVASISGNQQAPIWTAIARVETIWTEI